MDILIWTDGKNACPVPPYPGDPPIGYESGGPYPSENFSEDLMDRKEFIADVGRALVSTERTLTLKRAPEGSEVAVGGFDEKRVMGGSVELEDRSAGSVARAREVLLMDVRLRIPRGTRFYVVDGGATRIWKNGKAVDVDMIGWLYSPTRLVEPLKGRVIVELTA